MGDVVNYRIVTYRCRAGLVHYIHVLDKGIIPDGKYHVQHYDDDPGYYICLCGIQSHRITKEEFENDVETIDPPY